MTDRPAEMETERLSLRRHAAPDFLDCAALWADLGVMRFIGGPLGQEDSWARFLRNVGHWAVMGFGYWAVHETASGRFVGSIGFADYRRAMTPALDGAPELGWMLASWAHGRGFATEAVAAAAAWGDRQFGDRDTVCIIVPDHARSIRVAEKVGYRESHTAIYKDLPIVVFTRPPLR